MEISRRETELICETAMFDNKTKKQTSQAIGAYRPPSAKLEDAIDILTKQLNRALQTNKQTIRMGDINVDNLIEKKG